MTGQHETSATFRSAAEDLGLGLPITIEEYLHTGGEPGRRLAGLSVGGMVFRTKPSPVQIESWAANGGMEAVAALRQTAVEARVGQREGLNG